MIQRPALLQTSAIGTTSSWSSAACASCASTTRSCRRRSITPSTSRTAGSASGTSRTCCTRHCMAAARGTSGPTAGSTRPSTSFSERSILRLLASDYLANSACSCMLSFEKHQFSFLLFKCMYSELDLKLVLRERENCLLSSPIYKPRNCFFFYGRSMIV